jgi:F420H(2)-dependent quinone reductase
VVRLWFHNLRANPSVTVELGDRSFQAQAVVTEGRSATGSTA